MSEARFTKADAARSLSRILRTVSISLATLTEGMWNPGYCADDGRAFALSILDDIKREINHAEKLIARARGENPDG